MVNNPTKQYPSGVSKDIISIDPSILKSEIESGMITSKQLEEKRKKKRLGGYCTPLQYAYFSMFIMYILTF